MNVEARFLLQVEIQLTILINILYLISKVYVFPCTLSFTQTK